MCSNSRNLCSRFWMQDVQGDMHMQSFDARIQENISSSESMLFTGEAAWLIWKSAEPRYGTECRQYLLSRRANRHQRGCSFMNSSACQLLLIEEARDLSDLHKRYPQREGACDIEMSTRRAKTFTSDHHAGAAARHPTMENRTLRNVRPEPPPLLLLFELAHLSRRQIASG